MVAPLWQTTIGCWNMGAMVEVPQAGQVAKKMIEYGIEGLGMSRDR